MTYQAVAREFQEAIRSTETDSPIYTLGASLYNLILEARPEGAFETEDEIASVFALAYDIFKREKEFPRLDNTSKKYEGQLTDAEMSERFLCASYVEFYRCFNRISDVDFRAKLLGSLWEAPYVSRHYDDHPMQMVENFNVVFSPFVVEDFSIEFEEYSDTPHPTVRTRSLRESILSSTENNERVKQYNELMREIESVLEIDRAWARSVAEELEGEKKKEDLGSLDDKSRTPLHLPAELDYTVYDEAEALYDEAEALYKDLLGLYLSLFQQNHNDTKQYHSEITGIIEATVDRTKLHNREINFDDLVTLLHFEIKNSLIPHINKAIEANPNVRISPQMQTALKRANWNTPSVSSEEYSEAFQRVVGGLRTNSNSSSETVISPAQSKLLSLTPMNYPVSLTEEIRSPARGLPKDDNFAAFKRDLPRNGNLNGKVTRLFFEKRILVLFLDFIKKPAPQEAIEQALRAPLEEIERESFIDRKVEECRDRVGSEAIKKYNKEENIVPGISIFKQLGELLTDRQLLRVTDIVRKEENKVKKSLESQPPTDEENKNVDANIQLLLPILNSLQAKLGKVPVAALNEDLLIKEIFALHGFSEELLSKLYSDYHQCAFGVEALALAGTTNGKINETVLIMATKPGAICVDKDIDLIKLSGAGAAITLRTANSKLATIPGSVFSRGTIHSDGRVEVLSAYGSNQLLQALMNYKPISVAQADNPLAKVYPPLVVYGISLLNADGTFIKRNLAAAVVKAQEEEHRAKKNLGIAKAGFAAYAKANNNQALIHIGRLIDSHILKETDTAESLEFIPAGAPAPTMGKAMATILYRDLPRILSPGASIEDFPGLIDAMVWCGDSELSAAIRQALQPIIDKDLEKFNELLVVYGSGDSTADIAQAYQDADAEYKRIEPMEQLPEEVEAAKVDKNFCQLRLQKAAEEKVQRLRLEEKQAEQRLTNLWLEAEEQRIEKEIADNVENIRETAKAAIAAKKQDMQSVKGATEAITAELQSHLENEIVAIRSKAIDDLIEERKRVPRNEAVAKMEAELAIAQSRREIAQDFAAGMAQEGAPATVHSVSMDALRKMDEKFPGVKLTSALTQGASGFAFVRDAQDLNLATLSSGLVLRFAGPNGDPESYVIPGECFATAKTHPEGGIEFLSVRTSNRLLKAVLEYTPIRSENNDGKADSLVFPPLTVYGIKIVDELGQFNEENLKAAVIQAEKEEEIAQLTLDLAVAEFERVSETLPATEKSKLKSIMELMQRHSKARDRIYGRVLVNGKDAVTLDTAMLTAIYRDLPAVLLGEKQIEDCPLLLKTIIWCGVPELTTELKAILTPKVVGEEKLASLLLVYGSGSEMADLAQVYQDAEEGEEKDDARSNWEAAAVADRNKLGPEKELGAERERIEQEKNENKKKIKAEFEKVIEEKDNCIAQESDKILELNNQIEDFRALLTDFHRKDTELKIKRTPAKDPEVIHILKTIGSGIALAAFSILKVGLRLLAVNAVMEDRKEKKNTIENESKKAFIHKAKETIETIEQKVMEKSANIDFDNFERKIMEKISNHQKAIESSKKTIKEQEEECQRMFNNMGTLLEEERERDSTVEAKIAIAHIAAAEEVVNRAQAISVPVVVEHKISRPIVCALPQPNDKGFIIAEEKKEKEKEKARPSSNRYSWLHSDIGHTAGGTAPLSQLQQEVTLSLLRHK